MYSPVTVQTLRQGGVVIMRTDTIYGILALAQNQQAVEHVYTIKHRNADKSPIVLIDSVDQLFDTYDDTVLQLLNERWPGPRSIILPSLRAPEWIQRDNHSVAYRMPNDTTLRELIRQTGPLIAPSANPEGLPPATTIDQAKAYFGDDVAHYIDGGTVTHNVPSELYVLTSLSTLVRLR